eukprot:PhF_6_TR3315/c0_g1_i1/m.4678/K20477/RGP1; RAB6A-GEF complex partner protein 2
MLVVRGICDRTEYVVGSTAQVEISIAAIDDALVKTATTNNSNNGGPAPASPALSGGGSGTGWSPYSSTLLESYFLGKASRGPTSLPPTSTAASIISVTGLIVEMSGMFKVRREEGQNVFQPVSYNVVQGIDSPSVWTPPQVRSYIAKFIIPTTVPPSYSGYASRIYYSFNVTVSYTTNTIGNTTTCVLRIPIRVLSPIALLSTVSAPYVMDDDEIDFRLLSTSGTTGGGPQPVVGASNVEAPYMQDVLEAYTASQSIPEEITIREPASQIILGTLFISSKIVTLGDSLRCVFVHTLSHKDEDLVCDRITVHFVAEENGYHRAVLQEVDVVTLNASQSSFSITTSRCGTHSFSSDIVVVRHYLIFHFVCVPMKKPWGGVSSRGTEMTPFEFTLPITVSVGQTNSGDRPQAYYA